MRRLLQVQERVMSEHDVQVAQSRLPPLPVERVSVGVEGGPAAARPDDGGEVAAAQQRVLGSAHARST